MSNSRNMQRNWNDHAVPIFSFDNYTYRQFREVYASDHEAITFLSNYRATDMAAAILGTESTSLWIISPPDLQRLRDDLARNVTLKVQFKYDVLRATNTDKIAGIVTGERSFDLNYNTPARQELLNMLNNPSSNGRTRFPFMFPKFLKVVNLFLSCN